MHLHAFIRVRRFDFNFDLNFCESVLSLLLVSWKKNNERTLYVNIVSKFARWKEEGEHVCIIFNLQFFPLVEIRGFTATFRPTFRLLLSVRHR